jgi:glycosyltransferase involved in cell wall biosynthesis
VARIALVCEPPDGGVAEHLLHLASGLSAFGHEAVVFAPPEFKYRSELGARVLPFRRDYSHPWQDTRSWGALVRGVRGCDLVHTHSAKAGVIGRVAARIAKLPSVYTPHGFPFVGEMSRARRTFGVGVERGLAPKTDAIICVCEFERELARAEKLAPRRLAVVHNGTPPCPDVSVAPEVAALSGPVVGAVSTLRRAKRLDVLLAAWPAVVDAVPGAQLVIAGEGPEGPALLEQAAKLSGVTFLPFTGPPARYLLGFDVYVLSSSWESFPLGPLEAQACGVPQVVSAVGGTAESVDASTGVLVPPREPAPLAEAIVSLLLDPDRRAALSAASLARHAAQFTVERMVAGTAGVYEDVLA